MGCYKYHITIEGDKPPELMLGQSVGGLKVVAMEQEAIPNLVDVAWLLERFTMSKPSLLSRISQYNQGTGGKHLYDPRIVIPILEGKTEVKRGRKRVN